MSDKQQPGKSGALEWIRKATDDELNAKSILTHKDGTPSGVCFMSNQMGEKYLKAFLVANKNWFPKIHQLDALLEECIEIDPSCKEIVAPVLFLTTFYISTRYPGDYPEFTWDDAEHAFTASQKVKDFISIKLR